MTNPAFTVEGELLEAVRIAEPLPDGSIAFERLYLRSKDNPEQIISVLQTVVPADIADEFKVGVKARLVLFGVPSLRSHFLAGTFGDTSYLRVPATFENIRKTGFGFSAALGLLAIGSVYKWHGWGIIPAAIALALMLPFARFSRAYPSYDSVKKLLINGA